jgi:hypothetical protein
VHELFPAEHGKAEACANKIVVDIAMTATHTVFIITSLASQAQGRQKPFFLRDIAQAPIA